MVVSFLPVGGLVVAAAVLVVAECPRAGGRPVVVAERPLVAAPLGPCFVSGAAPRLRRRRLAAAVLRAQREGLPTLVLD